MRDPGLGIVSKPNMAIITDFILNDQEPFAEYMWMENEEEFNRQVEEELWEEEFMEHCFQEMLEEEQWEWFIPSRDLPLIQLQEQVSALALDNAGHAAADADVDLAITSSLNPNAKEFTPGNQRHVM